MGKANDVNAVQIAKFQSVNITESGTQNVQFDTNEILADGTGRWENFVGDFDFFAVGGFVLEDADFFADALDVTFGEYVARRHFEKLIFDC